MVNTLKLPVGIDSFEKIRRNGFYYIDKTNLIEQILMNWGEVTLFTRPRRFGKTLNMSMLKSFFEIGADVSLFEGLYIAKNKELCDAYMGKYPVIFLTLKGVEGLTFADAKRMLGTILANEMDRHYYLKTSDALTDEDKAYFAKMLTGTDENIEDSIRKLSQLLYKHHGKKVVIIIDEYDVPLDKAYQNGYYREMVSLIRGLFGQALKTNDYLQFAFLTGCLRVSKESIFTGLNNFKVFSIMDSRFDEQFGFTDDEVKKLLASYGLASHFPETKEWYDGYHFGNADVYCPWDVVNYCNDHIHNPEAEPENYWMNTSGNSIINHFIDSINEPDMLTKAELERLVNGKLVRKRVDEMITYNELYSTMDNLWSTLFMTGYLTQQGKESDGRYCLAIPNREIRNIITERILTLFRNEVKNDGKMAEKLCQSLINQQPEKVEELLNAYLQKTISIRDTFVQKAFKENFYPGILLGILSYKNNWDVSSNRESGNGFSDILIETDDPEVGIVIEVKYTDDNGSPESDCKNALKQIETKNYAQALEQDGIRKILKYGIAFQMKKCCVKTQG